MKTKNQSIIPWIVIGIFILVFGSRALLKVEPEIQTDTQPQIINPDWLSDYEEQRMALVSDEYVAETEFYDYDNLDVMAVTELVIENSDSPEEVIENALSYVYSNIRYVYNEPDEYCYNRKASDILRERSGQCDTQSTLLIAVLRGAGIATRPVGGCLIQKDTCQTMFALLQAASNLGVETRQPKISEAEQKENIFSRGRKAGGLHLWVEAWLPDKGWVTLETTAGKYANTNCWEYMVELRPDNNDRVRFCVTTDRSFAEKCYAMLE